MTSPSESPGERPVERAFANARRLLDCLCAMLTDTIGGAVGRCCVHPSTVVPMDGCCGCKDTGMGQAAVRVVRIFPTTNFPQPQLQLSRCSNLTWGAVLEMVVYRCVAAIDDKGCPPPCTAVENDARMILEDAQAMRQAIACCYPSTGGDPCGDAVVPDPWFPVANQGGCGGGTLQVTVDIGALCCPDAPS